MGQTKKACVVIPFYKAELNPYEQVSLDQCFRILDAHDIFFAVPERLEKVIRSHPYFLSGQAGCRVFDDRFFADIPAYNQLMKSPVFYKSFLAYDFLLLYQTDAFVFKDELLAWCGAGYDNIGAPLFEGHEQALADSPIVGQGNGGFCLRNVKACYQVVTRFRKLNFKKKYTDTNRSVFRNIYRYIKHQLIYIYSGYPFQPIINEDLFWAEEIPAVFPDFKVPRPAAAVGFSFEVNPEVLFEMNHGQLPFGCHAWWRYNPEFWKPHIESYGYEL